MINNRQGGRRGRGRNGARVPNGAPRPEQGNRIDNRARGNANQLHEKYKTLARDAQMQGDRVMTEYYLQFADHYFRVLSESRARFEEQRERRPQGDYAGPDGEDDYDLDGDEDERGQRQPRFDEQRNDQRNGRAPRDERPYRDRDDRNGFRERDDRPMRDDRPVREDRPARDDGEPRYERRPAEPVVESVEQPAAPVDADDAAPRRRRGRPPRDRANGHDVGAEADAAERIDVGVLPPSFAPASDGDGEDDKPRRVRRPRIAKADNDTSGDAAA